MARRAGRDAPCSLLPGTHAVSTYRGALGGYLVALNDAQPVERVYELEALVLDPGRSVALLD
jgi:hypothetical protein